MRPTYSKTLLLSSSLLLGALVTACDDGREANPDALPPPRAAAVAAAQAAAAPPAPVPTTTSLITEIDRHAFSVTSRDPFTPPVREASQGPGPTELPTPDCDIELDPLGETEVARLTLVGLITGTPVARAMFTIPGSSQAIFVTEGAKIGPTCSNRIVDIRDNEVVIEQMTTIEEDRTETILTLNEERIDEALFTNR
jgi:Tfp pilus assembly protein PilP